MERRLSAVFAIDMVGYSRLMEADEVGTLERQKAHRRELVDPALEEFHGRIIKEMGDGLLVEFPSVVEAVQCAVIIQRAMPEREAGVPEDHHITYRVGINLGDIIVEGDDIHGDGVNVAARLEAMAEPGGICISGTAFDHLRSTVEVGYESLGEVQVKNIERPIRAYRVLTEASDAGTVIEQPRRRVGPGIWAAIAAVLLLAIGAGGWWAQQPDFEPADPEKFAFAIPAEPSIAVLPFDNLSGDPSKDYLGDSLTENIIAELATVPELLVIARNSVFTYKGKPTDVRRIAEELGVKYVLEGSVQAEGNRMRVVAQLVNALDGQHLWAERYDYEISDIFDVQDDITRKLVEAMEVNLTLGPQAKKWREDFNNPEHYRAWIKGRVAFQKWNMDGHSEAERILVDLHREIPESPKSNLAMAYLHYQKALLGLSKDPVVDLRIAREYADAAIKYSTGSPDADIFLLLGNVDRYEGKYSSAITNINKALELAPSSAEVNSNGGQVKVFSGEPEAGVDMLRLAMRQEPSFPRYVPSTLAYGLIMLGRLDEAKEISTGLLTLDDTVSEKRSALIYLSVIAVLEGRQSEAERYLERALELHPQLSVEMVRKFRASEKNQEFVEKFAKALQRAGLPEHSPPKLPDKPSIAVLPFDNMSADPDQEYFSDGLTEDIITRLANIEGLFVVARNSSFTYKGKNAKVQDIGRDLGVRYVLEGSVRRSEAHVRINAQLIDAKDGGHLWAEKFDGAIGDVFSLQDEITARIAEALHIRLAPEGTRILARHQTLDVEAYDLFLKARQLHQMYDVFSGSMKEALNLYDTAITKDPTFANAYAYSAVLSSLVWRVGYDHVLPVKKAKQKTLQHLQKALELDPDNPIALMVLAERSQAKGEHARAVEQARHAASVAPANHWVRQALARILAMNGIGDEAVVQMDAAIRMNPHPTAEDTLVAAQTYLYANAYEQAQFFAQRTVDMIPDTGDGYLPLAASLVHLDRIEEAKISVARVLEIYPPHNWRLLEHVIADHAPAVREMYLFGLREAGLPEWPFGFEQKALTELSAQEFQQLLNALWVGNINTSIPLVTEVDQDGRWFVRQHETAAQQSGVVEFYDGKSCSLVDGRWHDVPLCQPIYKDPDGLPEHNNEYVQPHLFGIITFSPQSLDEVQAEHQ